MHTLRDNQAGVGHIVALLLVSTVLVIGLVAWRVMGNQGDTKPSPTTTTQTKAGNGAEPDLELQNLGLASFDDIDYTENALREYASNGLKGFYVFGDSLSGGRFNPNFEFSSLKADSKIVSAIDGKVTFIRQQADTNDYEVFVQPKDGSVWTIGYDHITNVAIKKDASIKAGDLIGQPAVQNNGLYRFEIQINKDVDTITTHVCPTVLLGKTAKEKWVSELTNMQTNRETTSGLELYDITSQNPIGCTRLTMSATEANGN